MSGTIGVKLDIDGYHVEVTIGADAIERRLRQAETDPSEEYVLEGPATLDLSKYAKVRAKPTDATWEKLTEANGHDPSVEPTDKPGVREVLDL